MLTSVPRHTPGTLRQTDITYCSHLRPCYIQYSYLAIQLEDHWLASASPALSAWRSHVLAVCVRVGILQVLWKHAVLNHRNCGPVMDWGNSNFSQIKNVPVCSALLVFCWAEKMNTLNTHCLFNNSIVHSLINATIYYYLHTNKYSW